MVELQVPPFYIYFLVIFRAQWHPFPFISIIRLGKTRGGEEIRSEIALKLMLDTLALPSVFTRGFMYRFN